MKAMIVIVDNRGLAFVGNVDLSGNENIVTIYNARCVIEWGTKGHLAELTNGPTKNTVLGAMADVIVFRNNLICAYEVDAKTWGL